MSSFRREPDFEMWHIGSALFDLGVWSFYAMYAAFGVPLSG
jgi:hypothetical protein